MINPDSREARAEERTGEQLTPITAAGAEIVDLAAVGERKYLLGGQVFPAQPVRQSRKSAEDRKALDERAEHGQRSEDKSESEEAYRPHHRDVAKFVRSHPLAVRDEKADECSDSAC